MFKLLSLNYLSYMRHISHGIIEIIDAVNVTSQYEVVDNSTVLNKESSLV